MSCTLSMFLFVCILLLFLHPFNVCVCVCVCVFFWVYLYLVVNLFNESNFHWQEWKKIINGTKWHIMKFIKFYFLNFILITTKLLCLKKIILIIFTVSAKQCGTQIKIKRIKRITFIFEKPYNWCIPYNRLNDGSQPVIW